MTRFDKAFIQWVNKHKYLISFMVITIFALIARYVMRNHESGDYYWFLHPWFDQLKAGGGLKAIGGYTGDYNAPYVTIIALLTYLPFNPLHLIKAVSIAGDFMLAISAMLLVRHIAKDSQSKNLLGIITYGVILFLPTVILNSAAWAQCDALYTSFIFFSLYALLKKKYPLSFILLGVALAFKLQAAFILPLYVILYFSQREFSMFNFLLLPAANVILSVPAMLFGWPPSKLITVYLSQADSFSYLSANFPNIYNLIPFHTDSAVHMMTIYGVLMTIIAVGLMLIYCLSKKIKWTDKKILFLAFWCIVIVTFLLPKMHERYLFAAEALGVILAIGYHRFVIVTLFIEICAVNNYAAFLNGGWGAAFFPPIVQTIIYSFILTGYTYYLSSILSEKPFLLQKILKIKGHA